MVLGLTLRRTVGLEPDATPTWIVVFAVTVPVPVAAVIFAGPGRPSAWKVAFAVPVLSTATRESMVPMSDDRRISVPGFRGLPSGRRPTTVMVEVPVREIWLGLALTTRAVPSGATGVALSQPTRVRAARMNSRGATIR